MALGYEVVLAEELVARAAEGAGDPAEVVANPSKAKELLGWEAKHSDLKTLVDTTWKAYLANGVVKG